MPQPSATEVWHVIPASELMGMLREVADGGDPEIVYLEHYVNSSDDEGD